MNVVSKIKQIGYEIVLDGAKSIGYQHSANLYVQLTMDTSSSSPFKDCVITAACSRWDSEMPDICPIEEIDNKRYILLTEDVFKEEGIVRLSIGGISKDKVVVTSNMLELRIRESNSVESNISQSESYMEIRILTAMKVWYKEVVDPYFTASTKTLNDLIQQTKDHENAATQLQQNAQTQQGQVATAINNAVKATSDASTAASNANSKATLANNAASAANTAKTNADTATANAQAATTAANKAKSDADTATANANTATTNANNAANNANTKASAAQTATTAANNAAKNANDKAALANTAATNADTKAQIANTAATAANTAKSNADKATTAANTAATSATNAAKNANDKASAAASATTAATQATTSANAKVQEIQQKLANGDFDGRTTYNGNGEPAVVLGKDGDTYLNKSNEGQHPKWLYLKEGGKWTPLWNTQGIDGTDTVPVGAGYLISGDTVPPGYKETTPPFSNPNLLINGDFQVWQRGTDFENVTEYIYTADGWMLYGSAQNKMMIKKETKGASIIGTAVQKLEFCLRDEIVTISAKIDGHVFKTTTNAINDTWKSYPVNEDGKNIIFAIQTTSSDITIFEMYLQNTNSQIPYHVEWIKIEYRDIATPFVPRPCAEELMLCQRDSMYYEEITSDVHTHYINKQNDAVVGEIHLPSCLRVKPTVSCSGITIRAINTSNSYKGKIHASRLNGNILYITIKRSDDSVLPLSTDGGYILVLSGLLIDAEIY